MRRTVTGFGIVTLVALAAAAPAQGQETDRQKVFYNIANSLGMLRTVNEVDTLMTFQAWGHGTVREVTAAGVGPEVPLKSYYAEFAYEFPGMRVDTVRGDGRRDIQVVSGLFAWNEIDKHGAGLTPESGKAVPAMETVTERLLRLWMTPFGVVKAARAAGDQAKITVENGRTVVTFPLVNGKPENTTHVVAGELAGTPVKLTLDAMYRPAQVEMTVRGRKHVSTYSNYGDLNEADYKADILVPARVVRTLDGQTVMDLTIDRTNTYNPYVIMPLPPAVQKAAGR
jgi:hypothetical protein